MGSGDHELVTFSNHLDCVDIMVCSGVGMSSLLIRILEILYDVFGKIYAVTRLFSELVSIIFH